MGTKRQNFGQNCSGNTWAVWVLFLKQDKYYIAYDKEDNYKKAQDKDYIKNIGLEKSGKVTIIECENEHEAFWTCLKTSIEMMQNYGIQNIRSDIFPDIFLSPMALSYIDNLIKHKVVSCYTDLMCFRCGRKGHSAEVCYAQSNSKGYLIDEYSESSNNSLS
ncbi:hypothetical protein SteCoe_14050 [Stentor coeruleus]|uniref:CCHC-type domain-containing protein n=1 Tax=Stentor coeruleus TaxID=5963 RepID=A0A1R2C6Z4_9CILI|nr:hypothetical protein SteCoe_14050 [Stentor coeruleus]